MAKNRIYLKCRICGEEFMLAKSYGDGFFREDYNGNLLQEFNVFLGKHTWCGDVATEGAYILEYEDDESNLEIIEQSTKTTSPCLLTKQTDEKPNLYECDPSKNTQCKKGACFINGGECRLTTKKEFKK